MTTHAIARALAVATVCLMLAAPAFAQEIGAKAGINFAKLTPEDDEDPDIDARIGFVGGGWVRWPINPGFSFQIEGLYSEQGMKVSIPPIEEFPGGDSEIRLRYFQVPLLARGDFGDASAPARFFLVGGLSPSFKIGARASIEADGQSFSQDLDDETKSFDLGLIAGGGVAFGPAVVEARYTHGLLHINEDDNGDDRIRNRVFSLMFGFRFR